MAPEQADSQKWGEVSPLTDVYALGIVAYEMIVGRLPFMGKMSEVLYAHIHEIPPLPVDVEPDIDATLNDVLLYALTKEPKNRFPNAQEFVNSLQDVANKHHQYEVHQTKIERLIEQARGACKLKNWLQAQTFCVEILRLEHDHIEAISLMEDAVEKSRLERIHEAKLKHLAVFYEDGINAFDALEWVKALTSFEKVVEIDPNYKDAQAKIIQTREQLRLVQLFDEADKRIKEKRWIDALQYLSSLLKISPNYRDGEVVRYLLDGISEIVTYDHDLQKLLEQEKTRAKLIKKELERYKRILYLYERVGLMINKEKWGDALQIGEKLIELEPRLNYVRTLVEQASTKLGSYIEVDHNHLIWRKDGKRMVRIPAGHFLLGEKQENYYLPDFWIDRTPVTNSEYKRFLDDNPEHPIPFSEVEPTAFFNWNLKNRTFPEGKANFPVTFVSWEDVLAYTLWAGKEIPAEIYWEKASRGIDGRQYPWGNQAPTPAYCNFGAHETGPTEVGYYSPKGDSPYGCVDMSGNVSEWVKSDLSVLGRSLRGGSWNSAQRFVGVTSRHNPTFLYSSKICLEDVGFRCVTTIEIEET